MKKIKRQLIKSLLLLAIVLCISNDVLGSDIDVSWDSIAINSTTGMLAPVSKIAMAVGGVIAFIGSVRIYQKWNLGDQDIKKELMGYGGSAAFLIIAPVVIKIMFGLSW